MPLARIADLSRPPTEIEYFISVAKQLSTRYDEFLDNFDEKHRAPRLPGIHASELKCMRKGFYSLKGIEKRDRTSRTWRKRFEVGHAIHDMTQKQFHRMAVRERAMDIANSIAVQHGLLLEFEEETKVSPALQELAFRYKIHSSCDGVFTFRDGVTGEIVMRIGLEIKTEAPDAFEKLNKPREDHVEQVHLYMACLDLPLVWFFYFNKGNQNNTVSDTPWLIPFNPKVWEKLENRIQKIHLSVMNNVEPDREESIACEFCPWEWYCQPRQTQPKQRQHVSVRRTGI
jgi:CRISPR/Cas system-associated exonuclease Cas4 (RecB family)